MPIMYLPAERQVSRESASPAKSALILSCSSSSYVLVIEPDCRLAVVNRIYASATTSMLPPVTPSLGTNGLTPMFDSASPSLDDQID